MSAHESIDDLVLTDTPVLTPDMPIRRAVATLVRQQVTAAAVIDDSGRLTGILSQKDCFRPALNASYYQEWKGTVGDFMSPDVTVLPADSDVLAAAEAFLEYPYRLFPIVDKEVFTGMLRRSDVLKRLVELG
ncbi:CBS domain-containing protein [Celeribacter sp.]|uniref:CBS domain-containing protein n=1 Tax=Celeribacter sp. TaxID=1890673 RepID=UPI003A8D9D3E